MNTDRLIPLLEAVGVPLADKGGKVVVVGTYVRVCTRPACAKNLKKLFDKGGFDFVADTDRATDPELFSKAWTKRVPVGITAAFTAADELAGRQDFYGYNMLFKLKEA